jgi:hypothetical protein
MKALDLIRDEAKVIVEQLADRQIQEMEGKNNKFQAWMEIEGNPVMSKYGDGIVGSQSAQKFISQDMNSGVELKGQELYKFFAYNKTANFRYDELLTMMRDNWSLRFIEDFRDSNMFKLNRALAKHLTNDMTASDIKVIVGGDGAEVTAIVDNKSFRTFGTLCGGWVQCLHYRYRSSLK